MGKGFSEDLPLCNGIILEITLPITKSSLFCFLSMKTRATNLKLEKNKKEMLYIARVLLDPLLEAVMTSTFIPLATCQERV